ncbi:SPOR domain-containing protein [Loktanella sp. R86503]|uniref:SPOR domain-containing protein n=1 Tax=Loktanella sp. R86503 TaxID=3093847 RepID=UPI0036DB18C5
MSATNFANAIALAATMAAGVGVSGAAAQSVPLPAEFPPSSYTGTQYVDSKGCAFVRAGMDGRVNWVPRVDRARQQLCNFQPTTLRTAVVPDPLPDVPIITVDNTLAPVTAAPTPVRAAAPQARSAAPAPVAAPAAIKPAPVAPPAVAPAVTPRVVSAPAPAAPRRITLAEACVGKTGVQPGFISASTRQPIDCGGAPQVAAVMQPPLPAASPAPQRLTLAAACAQQAATGRTLINAATRQPIICDVPASAAVAQAAAPVTQPAAACGIAGFNTSDRHPYRCGPQDLSPSGTTTALASTALPRTAKVAVRSQRAAVKPLIGAGPVPASNARASSVAVPAGYAQVWDDGRINHQRGLAKTRASVSSRTATPAAVQAPAAATGGHRYVQVGSFGDPANAARLIARLQGAGLPVASAKSGSIKVIAAGPFRSATDLNRALGLVRGMGFADAYLRS